MASGHLIVSRLVVAAGVRGDPKAPLHHLDLEVGEGQCAAVIGSGASALVRLLAGLSAPVRGCALLDGREVCGVAPDRVLVGPKLPMDLDVETACRKPRAKTGPPNQVLFCQEYQ